MSVAFRCTLACARKFLFGDLTDHLHFKAIAEYFKTNHLDHARLERICQVLDLAVCTSRRLDEYREDNLPRSEEGEEGLALSYLFDGEGAKTASCHDDKTTADFLEWFDGVLVKLKNAVKSVPRTCLN